MRKCLIMMSFLLWSLLATSFILTLLDAPDIKLLAIQAISMLLYLVLLPVTATQLKPREWEAQYQQQKNSIGFKLENPHRMS